MKSWVLSGDLLELADSGRRISANADQIYASILENDPPWTDLAPGRCGDAARIRFSRYPILVDIVIALDATEGLPQLKFEGRTQQSEVLPVSTEAIIRGHVVFKGTWYPIDPENAASVALLLQDSGYDPAIGRPRSLGGLLHLKKAASSGASVTDRLSDDALKSLIFQTSSPAGPTGIQATLYAYQLDGWRWLCFVIREQLGGLLADEMGLGKTLQVISALRDPGDESTAVGALVIAPGSLLENWVREIAKFCPSFNVYKHHGPLRTGRPSDLKCFDIVVVSYDTVIRDLSLLKMVEWNVVVLDEAQNIRNPAALRTRSVKELPRRVGLAMTGTPIENRLRDLWSIVDFLAPGYLGDLCSFEQRYEEDASAAEVLEPAISPLILRRRIADVARDLPRRIDIPEVLELTIAEAEAYEKLRQSILDAYGAAATLVSIGKLRQFCSHPMIVGEAPEASIGIEFSKLQRLKEILAEIFLRGEKALVFTSYTRMADLIATEIGATLGGFVETLDGRRSIDERQPLIDRFSDCAGPGLLILNPRAGGSGLNITAANHVVHYNPEWNPALEDQASARAHRRGQVLPVTIRRLTYVGTVEEVIGERLHRKRQIAESAIVGVSGKEDNYADIVAALERSPLG